MKKALIVTWFNGTNYGTLLQAYSLKKILENPEITGLTLGKEDSLNLDVSILSYIPGKEKNNLLKKIINFAFSTNEKKIKTIRRKISNKYAKRYKIGLNKREEVFENFRQKNFKFYPQKYFFSKEELKNINDFDYYIVGSDQVWNPSLLNEVYLLNWIESKEKISYAPSICVNRIPEKKLKEYECLKKFKTISIRENNEAVMQLEKITGKKISVVVDPVILLGRRALLDKCTKIEENEYAFSYFLSNLKHSRKYFINFCEKNNVKKKSIIAVNQLNMSKDVLLEDNAIWDMDPFELINTIYNSKFVITDSFHIMILAVLLHKDFTILSREKGKSEQNNRILNFLKLINLEERFEFYPQSVDEIKITEDIWNDIDKTIDLERKDSFRYLKCALEKIII